LALRSARRRASLVRVWCSRSWIRLLAVLAAAASLAACPEGSREPDASDPDGGAMPGPARCDVELPTECTDPDVGYADVEPIFERRCQTCHDGQGPEWPLLEYSHVADWAGEIRGMVGSCTMPPADSGMTMTVEEREAILLWIRCGFPR
jgi:cytochrome c5